MTTATSYLAVEHGRLRRISGLLSAGLGFIAFVLSLSLAIAFSSVRLGTVIGAALILGVCMILGAISIFFTSDMGDWTAQLENGGYIASITLWSIALGLACWFAVNGSTVWWPWGTFSVAAGGTLAIVLNTGIWDRS